METYILVLESQLGPRRGCLRLEERDGAVTGTLTLLGHDNAVHGRRTGTHTVRLCHRLRTLVNDLACISELEIRQGRLSGTLRSGGLGGQLRQSAGKQRDDNFGSFGVQFDHKALLLLAAILCLHFTTFFGFCTTAFACDTRRPALQ